jgi:hypothetical protein
VYFCSGSSDGRHLRVDSDADKQRRPPEGIQKQGLAGEFFQWVWNEFQEIYERYPSDIKAKIRITGKDGQKPRSFTL